MRRPLSVFGAALLAMVLAAMPASAAKVPIEVAIRVLSYDPVTVDLVAQGTSVRWSNVTNPNRLHDVVSSLSGYFQTSLMSSGESFEKRFGAAGTFTYICSIHDVMLGAVTVPLVARAVDVDGVTHFRFRLGTRPWHKWERYRYVLLRQDPGAASLTWWRVVGHNTIDFVPEVAGEYHFAARLKDISLGRPSGDSAVVSLTYTP